MYFGLLSVAFIAIALGLVALVYRLFWFKEAIYQYSMVTLVASRVSQKAAFFRKLLFLLRLCVLGLLCVVIAQPLLPDKPTQLPIEGIEIVLVLDLSASMNAVDDQRDGRRRVEIAKDEAISFVNKRPFDAIGLVVFGSNALSRCPLTLDHKTLSKIVRSVDVGNTVIPDGTVLSIGLLTALNRLKDSKAPSKIIIALTDGAPTQQDIPVEVPIKLAQELGVKIYTIGIGNDQSSRGMALLLPSPINTKLLEHIAVNSGGAFFMARNASEMHSIYNQIDKLEKRSMDITYYEQMTDGSLPFTLAALILIIIEIVISHFWLLVL